MPEQILLDYIAELEAVAEIQRQRIDFLAETLLAMDFDLEELLAL